MYTCTCMAGINSETRVRVTDRTYASKTTPGLFRRVCVTFKSTLLRCAIFAARVLRFKCSANLATAFEF